MNHKESFESFENKRDALVRLLKEKGIEDVEAREALMQWIEQEERAVEQANDPALAVIELNRKRGLLYYESGYVEEGLDSLEAAQTQAWNEHRDDLYAELVEEIDRIKKKMEQK